MRFLVKLSFKRALSMDSGDSWATDLLRGTVHSDTIFSGIINQWVKIPGVYSITDLFSRFVSESPPFQISSAFPYYETEYYLPTPRGTSELYMDILKDVAYLELGDFLKLANGKKSHLQKIPQTSPTAKLLTGFTSPRVTIDRLTDVSNIYDVTGWTISEGGGLYFFMDLHDETLGETLELCIRMLGESGIGSDRNVGYGVFDVGMSPIADNSEWAELFQPRRDDEVSYCTISLCCPADNKEAKAAISYSIISRSGWILSNSSLMQMKRRECKMFSEGSLFNSPISGCVANVTPSIFRREHNVYRYGLAMMVAGVW